MGFVMIAAKFSLSCVPFGLNHANHNECWANKLSDVMTIENVFPLDVSDLCASLISTYILNIPVNDGSKIFTFEGILESQCL